MDPALVKAARGMGMSTWQRLHQVEIPISVPTIMADIRAAVVLNIGIMVIATYIVVYDYAGKSL